MRLFFTLEICVSKISESRCRFDGSNGWMDLGCKEMRKEISYRDAFKASNIFFGFSKLLFFIHLLHSISCHTHYFITLCLVSWSNSTRSLIIPFIYPKLVPSDVILALVVCVLVDSFVCLCISKGPVQTPSHPTHALLTEDVKLAFRSSAKHILLQFDQKQR